MIACPNCDAHRWFINRIWSYEKYTEIYYIICKACGRKGPDALSEEDAISAWNQEACPRGDAEKIFTEIKDEPRRMD